MIPSRNRFHTFGYDSLTPNVDQYRQQQVYGNFSSYESRVGNNGFTSWNAVDHGGIHTDKGLANTHEKPGRMNLQERERTGETSYFRGQGMIRGECSGGRRGSRGKVWGQRSQDRSDSTGNREQYVAEFIHSSVKLKRTSSNVNLASNTVCERTNSNDDFSDTSAYSHSSTGYQNVFFNKETMTNPGTTRGGRKGRPGYQRGGRGRRPWGQIQDGSNRTVNRELGEENVQQLNRPTSNSSLVSSASGTDFDDGSNTGDKGKDTRTDIVRGGTRGKPRYQRGGRGRGGRGRRPRGQTQNRSDKKVNGELDEENVQSFNKLKRTTSNISLVSGTEWTDFDDGSSAGDSSELCALPRQRRTRKQLESRYKRCQNRGSRTEEQVGGIPDTGKQMENPNQDNKIVVGLLANLKDLFTSEMSHIQAEGTDFDDGSSFGDKGEVTRRDTARGGLRGRPRCQRGGRGRGGRGKRPWGRSQDRSDRMVNREPDEENVQSFVKLHRTTSNISLVSSTEGTDFDDGSSVGDKGEVTRTDTARGGQRGGRGRGGRGRGGRGRRPGGQTQNRSDRKVKRDLGEENVQSFNKLNRTTSNISLVSGTEWTDFDDGSSAGDSSELCALPRQRRTRKQLESRYKRCQNRGSRTEEQVGGIPGTGKQMENPNQEDKAVVGLLASLKDLYTSDMSHRQAELASKQKENQERTTKQRQLTRNSKRDERWTGRKRREKLKASTTFRKVYDILIHKYDGRAGFSQLLNDDNLPKEAVDAAWYRQRRTLFLLFEDEVGIKFVSVFSDNVRLCLKYNKRECTDEHCKYLHICTLFVTGDCKPSCSLSHNVFDDQNKNRIQELGLDVFTNKEVATIVRCSLPEWCEEYQRQGDRHVKACPLIHVCCRHHQAKQCSRDHQIKASEHNLWILKVYRMEKFYEQVLHRMLLRRDEGQSKEQKLRFKDESSEIKLKGILKKPSLPSSVITIFTSESQNAKANPQLKPVENYQHGGTGRKMDVGQVSHIFKFESDDDDDDDDDDDNDDQLAGNKPKWSSTQNAMTDLGRNKTRNTKTDTTQSSCLAKFESDVSSEVAMSATDFFTSNFDEDTTQIAVPLWIHSKSDDGDGSQDGSQDDTSDLILCEKHVWGECSRRSHFHGMSRLPYQWQIHMYEGWVFFEPEENEKIETAFCSYKKMIDGVKVRNYTY